MQVLDARVIERTADGAVVQFTIEARNGNNNPLPLREATYSLDLNGQTVFTGIRSAECTLRQSGVQQFVLPAAVKASSLASMGGAVRYRLAGSLTYVTPGAFAELLFDSGVARPSAGFSGEGEIDLPEAATPPSTTIGAR